MSDTKKEILYFLAFMVLAPPFVAVVSVYAYFVARGIIVLAEWMTQ